LQKPCVGLVGLAGQYEVGFRETPGLVERVRVSLEITSEVVTPELVMSDERTVGEAARFFRQAAIDLLVVAVGTWSEDHHLLDLLEECPGHVLLWAFPAVDTGSLCGVHQIACVLKELDLPYSAVYGEPEDISTLTEAATVIRTVSLVRRMRQVKIGTLGGRTQGMTEIAYDELELKARTGVRLVNLAEAELNRYLQESDAVQAEQAWTELKREIGTVTTPDEQGVEALRYVSALRRLVNNYDLAGLCVKCYPALMGKVCLAYSMLAEEGVVCGCEGDVTNTVAMKLLYELTGAPIHNTDLLYPDPTAGTVLFSHCGSGGFSLARSSGCVQLAPVRLAETGVCVRFPARPGPVTLVNLVGRRGTMRLTVLYGEAVETGMEFPGNPLKVRFDQDFAVINRRILEEGIGHHWMAGYGDVRAELALFCRLTGIRHIAL